MRSRQRKRRPAARARQALGAGVAPPLAPKARELRRLWDEYDAAWDPRAQLAVVEPLVECTFEGVSG